MFRNINTIFSIIEFWEGKTINFNSWFYIKKTKFPALTQAEYVFEMCLNTFRAVVTENNQKGVIGCINNGSFADRVTRRNPPLPGFQVHALPVLNHESITTQKQ